MAKWEGHFNSYGGFDSSCCGVGFANHVKTLCFLVLCILSYFAINIVKGRPELNMLVCIKLVKIVLTRSLFSKIGINSYGYLQVFIVEK